MSRDGHLGCFVARTLRSLQATALVAAALLVAPPRVSAVVPIAFDVPNTLPAAALPNCVVPADMNRDGRVDLIVSNGSAHTISIFYGNGSGDFGPHLDFDAFGAPRNIAVGDLNRDGIPDVAEALPDWNYLGTLPGTVSGGLGPYALTYTHSYTTAVAIANFNGDSSPDIAITENEYNAVDILLGAGNGGFSFTNWVATGSAPRAVIAGDLNGDGKTDLVVANSGANTISVLLGNGNATFAPKTDYPTASLPLSVAMGDLNGDGIMDLAVANSGSNAVSVYFGNGDGTFGPRMDYATGAAPASVVIADLNQDGIQDVVVANSGGASVSVFLGSGGGALLPKTDVAVGAGPLSVAVVDANNDLLPDLVTANSLDNTVTVLYQLPNLPPSSTTLVTSPNPSGYGQPVTLTATVSPSDAAGQVRFSDGLVTLGTAPLAGGIATLSTTALTHTEHRLWARYMGSPSYRASISDTVVQLVNNAGSTIVVSSSNTPAYFRLPVHFSATVSGVPPATATPTGTVQFFVDGTTLGTPATLTGGVAVSPSISTLSIGTHQITGSYAPSDTFSYGPSSSAALPVSVLTSNPSIVAVRDVPNDQGGNVFITWHCPLDQPGSPIVTGYRIWREVPNPASAPGARVLRMNMTRDARKARADSSGTEIFWEAIADLPAAQLVSYGYTAHTTQDSIAGSNPYSVFFVQALTTSTTDLLASAPDSGYSVDNLSPPVPAPFTAVYAVAANTLHWVTSPAPDLAEYRLYRGSQTDFIPSLANLVVATRDTGYTDAPGDFYYKLVAYDIHGNGSRVAMVSPTSPVAALASLVSINARADRIDLVWLSGGNAGIVASVYRRTLDSGWQIAGQAVADGGGYIRFDDSNVTTGVRYGYRLGIMDAGVEVFVGEAWGTAAQPALALEGVSPNPSTGGRIRVQFVLPNSDAATVSLFDVAGRRIASADVGSLGAGPHAIDVTAGQRLAPGVYIVRFTEGAATLSTRAIVLN